MPKNLPGSREPRPHTAAIVIAVQTPTRSDEEAARSLDELVLLAEGLGLQVVGRWIQRRASPSPTSYLGSGKLAELALHTGGPGLHRKPPAGPAPALREDLVVLVDDELEPSQARKLEAALGVEILDRTELILRVFQRRARTREAQLEVSVAAIQHELPRIRDDASLGDREGGGGRASRGNTNVELRKQHLRTKLAHCRAELERERARADRLRERRSEHFGVALIGYTNAGKSSLMRGLTGSDVLVEDKLFATLDTSTRPLAPASSPEILVTDTVGFLRRLPHQLIASFRATLAEAKDASILLKVVDASDPSYREQLEVTEAVLRELDASDTPAWTIFNKVDRLSERDRSELELRHPRSLWICSLQPRDVATVRERLLAFFASKLERASLSIPYDKRGILEAMRGSLRVLREDYGACIEVEVAGSAVAIAQLRKRLDQ